MTIDGYEALREMSVSREVGGTQVLHLRMQAQAAGWTALDLVDGAKEAAKQPTKEAAQESAKEPKH